MRTRVVAFTHLGTTWYKVERKNWFSWTLCGWNDYAKAIGSWRRARRSRPMVTNSKEKALKWAERMAEGIREPMREPIYDSRVIFDSATDKHG